MVSDRNRIMTGKVVSMPVLLTIAEVAARMGISKLAVYRRISGGDLRAIRISSKALRVLELDLQAYLDPVGPELTVKEAAAVLKLSPSTIYELIEEKKLAATKRGPTKQIRILRGELQDYIKRQPIVTNVPANLFRDRD